MEELVGHDLGPGGDSVVAVGPDGGRVRLQRLPPALADSVVPLLTAAAGDHVEALLDVGTAPGGDAVLVLPSLPAGLGELLRHGLTPGEAVTILVPLAATVERLHAAGVAHGNLAVAAVRFDERGAPFLTGFERGTRREAAADEPFAAAVASDDAAFRAVAGTVLGAAGPRAAALARELASGALATTALQDALFALAEPAPVRLQRETPQGAAPEPPGRLVAPAAARVGGAPSRRTPAARTALRRLLEVAWAKARRVPAVVRLRVWVAAGGSLALLAGALVLLPGRVATGAPEVSASPPPLRTAAPVPTPHRSWSAPAVPAQPLAAGRILLTERHRCLLLGSEECLARVESAGSPVAIEDAAAVAGAVEAVGVQEDALRVRSTSGATAVLTAPGRTVLLVRELPGWRLRDVIGPPTRRSTARSDGEGN